MALALTNPGTDPRVHFKAIGVEEKSRESESSLLGVREHTGSDSEGIHSQSEGRIWSLKQ